MAWQCFHTVDLSNPWICQTLSTVRKCTIITENQSLFYCTFDKNPYDLHTMDFQIYFCRAFRHRQLRRTKKLFIFIYIYIKSIHIYIHTYTVHTYIQHITMNISCFVWIIFVTTTAKSPYIRN